MESNNMQVQINNYKKNKSVSSEPLTYISLFNGGGVGCHGFQLNGFDCIAVNEILEKRLKIQKFNNKCKYDSGYVLGDLSDTNTKNKIYEQMNLWKINHSMKDIDVVIATPPCQGMSVANHKKKNESQRNSLVIHALLAIKTINPKIIILENVRTFLTTQCIDTDHEEKSIYEAIITHLSDYNIHCDVLNFKNYGNPSQRTRTVVVGVRKDLKNISPYDIMPSLKQEQTIHDVIGELKPLKKMGMIDKEDIYHFFREYDKRMINWICDLKEGESAFENKNISKKPHHIKNGVKILNQNKNGDKYKRCYWNKPMYCIHTRNDILASQMTIHPEDNRVFSIRELMKLMTIPDNFKWSETTIDELNQMKLQDKKQFLKKEELNIRQCMGEAVPTIIFSEMAQNIKDWINTVDLTDKEITHLIKSLKLENYDNLVNFVKTNLKKYSYADLSKIIEFSNNLRHQYSAYYTSKEICFSIVESLPKFNTNFNIRILEPSVGTGNFLPLLIKKYEHCSSVSIDVIDIDHQAINLLKLLVKKLSLPNNFSINYINDDFLTHKFETKYDVIVGNPPFKKIINNKDLLYLYKNNKFNTNTNNIFSFFIENALSLGKYVSFIVPKSLLSTPELNKTRDLIRKYNIIKIVDFGERAFNIKIETIGIILNKSKYKPTNKLHIESYITNEHRVVDQSYIISSDMPYWLIYRNQFFDMMKRKMKFGIFTVFRDRQIRNKILRNRAKYRVLKSRNIDSNKIVNISGYDKYVDKNQLESLAVKKYMNRKAVLIPNLTYLPRACFMPNNVICDGSVAIAIIKDGEQIDKHTLEYYSTDEFRAFYRIARNKSTRSMNIDSNSIHFFGKLI